ncbi:nitrite reductase small subunit NirD [Protaetiibacter intestinalis]|uniref:Nitrite reductase (NAD(P)H) small subunit n=1 Tax=Protaetiibacter intestinalis TaxID=2419774 RepID=A0A387B4M5_9MICO|nr:nitrite reductase small subunit NirD [Protaetiibacter intestinalis]AYF98594.1 nitrite reductase (NAD(P)H) small subunit [Protaetiibacter intestinalis]
MSITIPGPTASAAADDERTEPAAVGWFPVCEADALEPAWGEAVFVEGRQIALVLAAPGELYAVDHRDPVTSSYVMARGIVGSRGDRATIASPLLKQVYDLQTGACLDDPALALATYRTRVVGGMVEVEVAA